MIFWIKKTLDPICQYAILDICMQAEIRDFQKKYPKFANFEDMATLQAIFKYIKKNRLKMIWAIEDLDEPPLVGIAKGLLATGLDFNTPENRRLTGAIIAYILSDEYVPAVSGHRVKWRPFRTSSKYMKIQKASVPQNLKIVK